MTFNEPITLTPHVGDRVRDTYWAHPTAYNMLALFVVSLGVLHRRCCNHQSIEREGIGKAKD